MDVGMTSPHDHIDDIDALNHLEQRHYASGYKSGFSHGRLHGLFEGRALGQEKGFELWEELGYMLGIAEFWREVGKRQSEGMKGGKRVSQRALVHIETLLNLISAFPIYNPSEPTALTEPAASSANSDSDSSDLAATLERIRARYRLLCSSLGIRSRLATAATKDGGVDELGEGSGGGGVVQGIEGPMKGVDTRLLRF